MTTNSPQQPAPNRFLEFLASGIDRGGFETDDVIAAIVPLMRQTLSVHELELVAPLAGVQCLLTTDQSQILFDAAKAVSPRRNLREVEKLQAPMSAALDVVSETVRSADLDKASLTIVHRNIAAEDDAIVRPVFVPNYRTWEHAVGHHDEITDVFSLGMILASLALGLDFTDSADLERFVSHRSNLFALRPRLNPVLGSVIVQMTELNRHKRAPDIAQLISRLENYREQPADLDFDRLQGFKDAALGGKRRIIQSHLRDRLFEISRRNRLIYFKPTFQTLNLTLASVPILLDYRNIRLEQLFVWHPAMAATIIEGAPMSLGKYLRFEDAPYIPGVLDKLISEARRDRAEYGFAQLRLVLCFLRWHDLKETPEERIHSPLLLLPVELAKKKGVRDNYVLDPTTNEAEVNPALRHHLKELYGLDLPETVNLRETPLDQFYESLKTQIQRSHPGVTLNKIERPQVEFIHEKARQRLDQYRRRLKVAPARQRDTTKPDYSYDRRDMRPLGLRLFLDRVRPAPMPMRLAAGADAPQRQPRAVEPIDPAANRTSEPPSDKPAARTLETERETFAIRDGGRENPYSWDFDLCAITLGNFNYRKMTLVRDYTRLIETDLASDAFDTIFSLAPKPPETPPPPQLPLSDQHVVISCDATQASAIARARTGASYIIQGPPGTGKSQTITNLIADYVARGKRVLFVCEKRAAIDVVFHRLSQQGLDELCCLIHDSQTDKKSFIQNLKLTYEKHLAQESLDPETQKARSNALLIMDQELTNLARFSDVMHQAHPEAGIGVRRLLHRLISVRGRASDLPPATEDLIPTYPLWLQHGTLLQRLEAALAEPGAEPVFSRHPVRWLADEVLLADRPIELLCKNLDRAEDLLDGIEEALAASALPPELWDTFEEIQAILGFAVRARPLAPANLLGALANSTAVDEFDTLVSKLDNATAALTAATAKTAAWRNPLTPDDTQNALAEAQRLERSALRFLRPSYWRLRKTMLARYDFAQHAVPPAWTKVLNDLAARHEAEAARDAIAARIKKEWRNEDIAGLRTLVTSLRSDPQLTQHASIKPLLQQLDNEPKSSALIEALAALAARFEQLDAILRSILFEHDQFEFPELRIVLARLREQTALLTELSPFLGDIANLPAPMAHALRKADLPLNEFEGAMAHKSLNRIYRQDRSLNRFDGRGLARRLEQLRQHHQSWLGINARCIRQGLRTRFLDHVNLSSQAASQLTGEEKSFKKAYAAGRRELEHEFGKTMRYKSIRDLAAGEAGQVIQDLKPIWLMSPLSVSDTLPLDPDLFDVVIFDEASQIPLEEAIPAIYRSHQVIIVGDEMQLPPTTFFAGTRSTEDTITVEEQGETYEVDLDSDSLLTQSARNLPSTLLAWHYRSRYESLISYSNAAFYGGNLFTIPDRQRAMLNQRELLISDPTQGLELAEAVLARSISFHFMKDAVYDDRRNPAEAAYIAQLVKGILQRETGLSIGVVAFSEAQQGEIESALAALADEDPEFAARLEAETVREENDVFCGLFVKNLENVQGDERDIIIMSVCYGHDPEGRMLMSFGPINQRGGEKRLNVIFSRAKHHMAIVSSIRHHEITNDYNDGANNLKNFLRYAEAVSKGDEAAARRVLESLGQHATGGRSPAGTGGPGGGTNAGAQDTVVEAIAAALRQRGHVVERNVGQSRFRCDLAVRSASDDMHRLAVLIDTDAHYSNPNLLDRYLLQPSILRSFGWHFVLVLTKDWYHNPDDVLLQIEKALSA